MRNPKTNTVKIHAKVNNNNAKVKITAPSGKEILLESYNSTYTESKKPKKNEIDAFLTGLLFNKNVKELLLKNSKQEFHKWGDKVWINSICRIELELTGDIEKKYRFDFVVENKIVEREEEVGV
jgi:ribosomal protein S11